MYLRTRPIERGSVGRRNRCIYTTCTDLPPRTYFKCTQRKSDSKQTVSPVDVHRATVVVYTSRQEVQYITVQKDTTSP